MRGAYIKNKMKRAYEDHDYDDDDEDDDEFLFDHNPHQQHMADTMMFEEDEPVSVMYIDQVPLLHGPTTLKDNDASSAHQGPKFEVQRIVPVRSEKLLLDNVCYFKQQALITLLYGNVTQGVKVPGLFDQDQQRLYVLFKSSKITHFLSFSTLGQFPS